MVVIKATEPERAIEQQFKSVNNKPWINALIYLKLWLLNITITQTSTPCILYLGHFPNRHDTVQGLLQSLIILLLCLLVRPSIRCRTQWEIGEQTGILTHKGHCCKCSFCFLTLVNTTITLLEVRIKVEVKEVFHWLNRSSLGQDYT